MKIKQIIYSPAGRIIISMLLGLGLSTIFRKACTNRSCLVFKAAPLNKIKGHFTNNFKPYVIGKITKNFKDKVKLNGSVNWI